MCFCWHVQLHLLHVCQLTTSHTHHVEYSKVKSCILDGEMVGWDAETESFLPKGDHVDVKTIGKDEDSGIG
jgi:hypothetical protein